ASSRDGGSIDNARSRTLVKELEVLASGQPPVAAASELQKPAAVPEVAPVASDDGGSQPIPFSFDGFGDDDGNDGSDDATTYEVSFRPRRELYATGNEAALLLRDLSRIGEMSINCDTDTLPPLDQMDPEESYFGWTISLKTSKAEDEIRTVFEFAEWDCELEVQAAAPASTQDELPMVPVPFDLSALDGDEPESADEAEATLSAAQTAASVSSLAAAAERVETKQAAVAPAAAAQTTAVAAAGQTIRVDLDRVDRLINLVGELVINQAMLSQSVV